MTEDEQQDLASGIIAQLNKPKLNGPVSVPVELSDGFKCTPEEREAAAADYAEALLNKTTLNQREQRWLASEIIKAVKQG